MRRPLVFPRMAGNSTLAIGSGIAQGLNQALLNYHKVRFQNSQMENNRIRAQAEAEYRKIQGRALAAKSASIDMDKIDLLNAASQRKNPDGTPYYPPKLIEKYMGSHMERALQNIPPEQIPSLTQRMHQQAAQGQIPKEFASDVSQFSPNESAYLRSLNTNQTKENVAGIGANARMYGADTSADARKYAADAYGRTRENVAKMGANAKGATDINSEINTLHKSISALDRPPPPGGIPLDPEAKQALRKDYMDQIRALHQSSLQPKEAPVTGPVQDPVLQQQGVKIGDTYKGHIYQGGPAALSTSWAPVPAAPAGDTAPAAPAAAPEPVEGE